MLFKFLFSTNNFLCYIFQPKVCNFQLFNFWTNLTWNNYLNFWFSDVILLSEFFLRQLTTNVLRLCRSCELRTAIFSTKLRHNFERKNFRRKFISQFRKTAVRRSVDFENWCWILNRMCLRDYRNYVQSLEFWLVSF